MPRGGVPLARAHRRAPPRPWRGGARHNPQRVVTIFAAAFVASLVVRSGSGLERIAAGSGARFCTASPTFRAMPPLAVEAGGELQPPAASPSDVSDASASASAPSAAPAAAAEDADETLVQFVVVRRDLLKTLEWPVGSVIAQACHACLAVAWEHKDDPDVVRYLAPENVDAMHKVTKEVKGEPQLRTLADKLKAEGIAYKLWTEQPENIPTAIALKPYPASRVKPLLKKYQLFK